MRFVSVMRAGVCSSPRHIKWLMIASALVLAVAPEPAKAGFVGYYGFSNFTLSNSGGFLPNGHAASPNSNTLILTGPNSGSGLPELTDFTIQAAASGLFQFDYMFDTLNLLPGNEFAGYLLGGSFTQLANVAGESGTVSVPVLGGELIGFRVGAVESQGEPGVLTITGFSAPVPEPGSAGILLFLAAVGLVARVRPLIRRRFGRNASAVCVLVASACFSAPMQAQQLYYTGINVTGAMALAGVVDIGAQAQISAPLKSALRPNLTEPGGPLAALRPASEKLKVPGPRLRPRRLLPELPRARTLRPLALTTPVTPLSIVQPSAASGFNALSHQDQRLADNGNQFSIEPPSPSVAVGNGYVLEGVNDAVQVYSPSGSRLLASALSSNQWFGLAPAINRVTNGYGVYLTDMHVYFDQDIDRWFVAQWTQDGDASGNALNSSHLYLAVSQTADPTAKYNIYIMNTTNPNHPQCPCVPDYPQFGADHYGFHITWNEYSTYTNQFVDAAVLTLSKASLAIGSSAPTAFEFLVPYITGYEFSLRPAVTPPGAAPFLAGGGLEYLVSTLSSFSFGSQIALWAVANTSSLPTQNPNLTLTRVLLPSLTYAFPPVAAQRPGLTPYGASLLPPSPLEFLDGGDPRVQSLSYASGRLYLTLATGVNDANGKWVVGGAYIVLSPTYHNSVLAGQVLNQGYLLVNNNHLLRPAIAVNAQGAGAIAVTLVGADWYPSAAFIPFDTFSAPSTIQVAALGTLPEDGFSGYPPGGYGVARWGDYNTAYADNDGSIWMAIEYIGSYSRTDYANWNTYIVQARP